MILPNKGIVVAAAIGSMLGALAATATKELVLPSVRALKDKIADQLKSRLSKKRPESETTQESSAEAGASQVG